MAGNSYCMCSIIHSFAMNHGILEGMEAHGQRCDPKEIVMLPGNRKYELPLIFWAPSSHTIFIFCLVFILIIFRYMSVSSLL